MAHLAIDSAVRTCDALNIEIGAVDVPVFVTGDIAVGVAVACRDLAVILQSADPPAVCYKAALSVGSGHRVDTAFLAAGKPW